MTLFTSRRQFITAGLGVGFAVSLSGAHEPEPRVFPVAEGKKIAGYERLARAFDAILTGGLPEKPPGRYELDGLAVYAMVTESSTKDPAQGHFETHRQYADVHYLIDGHEMIGSTNPASLAQYKPYDPKGDAELFQQPASFKKLHLTAGRCAVFLPGQAHMPGCWDPAESKVRKIVVKVRLSE